ncbi:hypothetical protein RUND412_009347 [Rhizina undulata]
MLIAAKYGDKKDRVPSIRELKSLCDNLFDEDMFIQMEWRVLQKLWWIVGNPTVECFLQIVLQEVSYDPEVESMARYLSEIALFNKEFISVRPSVIARSSLALARNIFGRPVPRHSERSKTYDINVLILLTTTDYLGGLYNTVGGFFQAAHAPNRLRPFRGHDRQLRRGESTTQPMLLRKENPEFQMDI